MKKILLVLFFIPFCMSGYGATVTIVNVGLTFSPTPLTINQGDDVIFSLNSILHNAVEVSQTTWNAEGVTPLSGGFSVDFGGGSVSSSLLTVGTHYYVCTNHVTFGMRGIIIVQASASVPETNAQNAVQLYPNPAKENITVQFSPSISTVVEIKLFDLQGKLVAVLIPKTEVSGLFLRTFSLNKITGAGVYFVQIVSGDNTTYQKVVIL